jgi:hypothetical protein
MARAPVPTYGPRVVCTRCGIIGVDARPNGSLLQCNTPLPRWATNGLMHRSKQPLVSMTKPAT